jgi:hypothetical protein
LIYGAIWYIIIFSERKGGASMNVLTNAGGLIALGQMTSGDILLIVVVVIAALIAGLYFLNRWAYKKMDAQNEAINQHKMSQQAYIIDKKRCRITEVKMPKAVYEQLPRAAKYMKMNFVQCKIGPQIVTLIADKRVYKALQPKTSVKIEIAGLYIVNKVGMKTIEEENAEKRLKKEAEKAAKREAKKKK